MEMKWREYLLDIYIVCACVCGLHLNQVKSQKPIADHLGLNYPT